jgi:hypothetical protein
MALLLMHHFIGANQASEQKAGADAGLHPAQVAKLGVAPSTEGSGRCPNQTVAGT